MFGISGFFGPFSVGIWLEFVFLCFRSLMSSMAEMLCCRAGGGSGGGGGGGGGGGTPGTAAEATGVSPAASKTCATSVSFYVLFMPHKRSDENMIKRAPVVSSLPSSDCRITS